MTDQPIKPDPDKKPKRPRDANQLAKNIVDLATGQAEEVEPAANNRGKGGKSGGHARAKALNAEQRAEIARKAAAARWGKKSNSHTEEQNRLAPEQRPAGQQDRPR